MKAKKKVGGQRFNRKKRTQQDEVKDKVLRKTSRTKSESKSAKLRKEFEKKKKRKRRNTQKRIPAIKTSFL